MKKINPNIIITPNHIVLICSGCGVDERGDTHWNPKHFNQQGTENVYKTFCPTCLKNKTI